MLHGDVLQLERNSEELEQMLHDDMLQREQSSRELELHDEELELKQLAQNR